MFSWFVGRKLRRVAMRDLRVTKCTVVADGRLRMARALARRMASVERPSAAGDRAGALTAALEMLTKAEKDLQVAACECAGSYVDPPWLLADLSETWAKARIAALEGRLSASAFRKVDAVYGRFLAQELKPGEIEAMGLRVR
jgi:hypothetical protein